MTNYQNIDAFFTNLNVNGNTNNQQQPQNGYSNANLPTNQNFVNQNIPPHQQGQQTNNLG